MSFDGVLKDKEDRVFSDKEIESLIENAAIYSENNKNLLPQVKPASFDTTISGIVWELPSAILFKKNESIRNLDEHFSRLKPNNRGYFILEPEKHYIFLLNECVDLDLYKEVYVKANPKSSIGRVDLFTRLVTDSDNKFDYLRPGYRGPLGVLLESKTFRIGLKEGLSLNQLRFQIGNPKLSDLELHKLYSKHNLLLDNEGYPIPKYDTKFDGGLLLSLNLEKPIYLAKKGVEEIIYLDGDRDKNSENCADSKKFFEKITSKNGELILKKGEFILGCTDEVISFPANTCGDLESYNDQLGPDARVDYAGFADPNWTSRLTYEIRANEDLRLFHKMLLARIFYLKLKHRPKTNYGKNIGSHYGKNLKTYTELPRYLKEWKEEQNEVLK